MKGAGGLKKGFLHRIYIMEWSQLGLSGTNGNKKEKSFNVYFSLADNSFEKDRHPLTLCR
jgi:hypothetical protein